MSLLQQSKKLRNDKLVFNNEVNDNKDYDP